MLARAWREFLKSANGRDVTIRAKIGVNSIGSGRNNSLALIIAQIRRVSRGVRGSTPPANPPFF